MDLRYFFSNLMTAIAAVASLVTLVSFLIIPEITSDECAKRITFIIIPKWITIILIVGGCPFYAWLMSQRKKKIKLMLNPSFELTIKQGDLFDHKNTGIIVIPVNNHFNPSLVSRESSVFNTFIQSKWKDRMGDLNLRITEGLNKLDPGISPSSNPDYKQSFPLGSCIQLKDGGNTYVLFVAAEYDEKKGSLLSACEYAKLEEKLFSYLVGMKPDKRIYLPLFGTGHGRMMKTHTRVLYYFLDEIEFNLSKLSFPFGVTLMIKSLASTGINLNDIERDFNSSLKS